MTNKGESSSGSSTGAEPGRPQLSKRGKEALIQPHHSNDPAASPADENAADQANQSAPVFDQNGEVLAPLPRSSEARAGAFLKDWMRRLNRMGST